MKSYIVLENVEFYAYHGVYPEERKEGNNFLVNIKATVDFEKASYSDDLADTVSYAEMYDLVKEEMMIPSDLIEHVAGRVLRRIKSEMEAVQELEVRITKKNPPIDGKVESASVVLIG